MAHHMRDISDYAAALPALFIRSCDTDERSFSLRNAPSKVTLGCARLPGHIFSTNSNFEGSHFSDGLDGLTLDSLVRRSTMTWWSWGQSRNLMLE